MSTKPTSEPRWAETAAGTPSGDITEPSSGEKDVGFQNGDPADAEKMNWILWLTYKWVEWLNDGDVSFATISTTGDVSIGDDLTVTDQLTFVGEHHGDKVLCLDSRDGFEITAGDWTRNISGYVEAASANRWHVPLPLDVGDRVKSVSFQAYGDGVTDLILVLRGVLADGTVTALETTTSITNMAASWNTFSWDLTDHTLGETNGATTVAAMLFDFARTGGSGAIRIGAVKVTYDRP